MANRRLIAYSLTDGFVEEILTTDTTTLGGLTLGGNLVMGGNQITGLGSPTISTDGANKAYVDAAVAGIRWKPPVRALATSNVASLSGTTTIDSVPLVAGDRVLLTAQSTAAQNGIWVVAAGAWTRPVDYPTGGEAFNSAVFVSEGTAFADSAWVCTTNPPADVIDTNSTAWVQFSSPGVLTAGSGLTQTGVVISVKAGDGIEIVSNSAATNVALDGTSPGLFFTGASPNGRLKVLADPGGGLQVVAAGVQVKIVSTDRLLANASGLDVTGVPLNFKINGVATSSNVTSANLGTLTAGSGSNADTLHTHTALNVSTAGAVRDSYITDDNISAADPVYITGTANHVGLARADTDAKARVIALNDSTARLIGATANVYALGPNPGVLVGATPGTPYFLQPTGGIGTSVPGAGNRVVECGVALSATDLWVRILDFGKKP